jgi:Tol biopolymer transport system component
MISTWHGPGDGSRLAFRRVDSTNKFGYLWVVNADGSGGRNLTPTRGEYSGRPDWSPDGGTILFAYWNGFGQLATIRPDGTHETPLTTGPGDKDCPVWAPDGVRIAFAGTLQGAGVYLTTVGGSPETLTRAGGTLQNKILAPSWSPDGTKIAFGGAWDLPGDIYVMNADGSGIVRLTTSGKAGSLDWLPATAAA